MKLTPWRVASALLCAARSCARLCSVPLLARPRTSYRALITTCSPSTASCCARCCSRWTLRDSRWRPVNAVFVPQTRRLATSPSRWPGAPSRWAWSASRSLRVDARGVREVYGEGTARRADSNVPFCWLPLPVKCWGIRPIVSPSPSQYSYPFAPQGIPTEVSRNIWSGPWRTLPGLPPQT